MYGVGRLYDKVMDNLAAEGQPVFLLVSHTNRQRSGPGGENGPADGFSPDVLRELRLGDIGEIALKTAVVVAATVQDDAVHIVGRQFFQERKDVCLDVIIGGIQENGSLYAFVVRTAQAVGRVLDGGPGSGDLPAEDGAFALQAIVTAVATHKGVQGGVHLKAFGMADIDKGLQVIPSCFAVNEAVVTPLPRCQTGCGRGDSRIPQHGCLCRTHVNNQIRKTYFGQLLYFLCDISLVIGKIREIGRSVNPHIAGDCLRYYGIHGHRLRTRSRFGSRIRLCRRRTGPQRQAKEKV